MVTAVWVDLGLLRTLMLLMLTSVKELSLLFIFCRVSSTFVGLGGSSNTGTIFSPLITSTNKQAEFRPSYSHQAGVISTSFCWLTVVAFFSWGPIVRLSASDQSVDAEDSCKHEHSTQWLSWCPLQFKYSPVAQWMQTSSGVRAVGNSVKGALCLSTTEKA